MTNTNNETPSEIHFANTAFVRKIAIAPTIGMSINSQGLMACLQTVLIEETT